MGFLSNLFNRKSKEEREMDKMLKKIHRLLNDEEFQNTSMPDWLLNKLDTRKLNKLPNAIGEFGRDPRNPILCNGVLGEITYLSRLVIPNPNKTINRVTFHRLGSIAVVGTTLDKYEIISYDGYLYDILYLDCYHRSKSTICPKGYLLEDECVGIRGTDQLNSDFPYKQYESVKYCATDILGVLAFDTQLKEFDVEQAARTMNFLNSLHGSMVWWNENGKIDIKVGNR